MSDDREEHQQTKLDPDADPDPVETETYDDDGGRSEEIPESVQPTLTTETVQLGDLQDPEPPHPEHGHRQVVTTSSTNGRGSYHKQDPHADEIVAKCETTLQGDGSEWLLKPKTAMERSSTSPCPDCYPGGEDSDV